MTLSKNKIILLILIIICVFLIGGFLWLQNQKKQEVIYQTPQEAAEQIVKQNLNSEFWPDSFNAVKDDSNAVALGLGRNFADNYALRWSKADSYFLVFIGFDKTKSTQLNGYVFNIYQKGIIPNGYNIPKIYFKNIPEENWLHGGPKTELTGETTSELSSVLFKKDQAEIYLRILSISTNIPSPGIIPEEQEILTNLLSGTISKEFTKITLQAHIPNYPRFGILKEVQQLDHSTY